ncbi:IclR family transcriptional regulator [Dactylosporangium sp. NPDC048998]|uniref:IclR family transcriptional regulator n=1 Tax=Dactylosporangium sp. NPDC048998 TaxID=3363976 RepID=UPI00371940ED
MDDRTVTGRVIAVLDAVAQSSGRATLAALTRSTGIPKPTVRRIAADLVTRGMLERDVDGYRLGAHLLQLGAEAAKQQDVRRTVAPFVHDLFARTGEIAWMTAFTDTSNTLVESAFGSQRIDDMRHPWPAVIRSAFFLTTAAGRLVLAHRPELIEDLRSRALPRLTRYTVTNWGQVANSVELARDNGVAIEHEQTTLGYSCIAAGIHDRHGNLVGAIGVSGRTSTFLAERLRRPVRSAANQLSQLVAAPY